MKLSPKVAAGSALIGLIALGGASLAYAETTPTTTTPATAPAPDGKAPSSTPDDANCPNMGGEGGGGAPATPSAEGTSYSST